MTLSREEIMQLARFTAQEVLNGLDRYTVEYKEPDTIHQGLHESMGEELTASSWYRRRAINARLRQGDEETAKLYEHIAEEEDKHYGEFDTRLNQLSKELKPSREKIKFQYGLEDSPYSAGETAGMRMDTIQEALENLRLVFTEKQVTISPWLTSNNTLDLFWVDSNGSFTRGLDPAEWDDFKKGLTDWLRPSIKGTRKIWPINGTV